MRQPIQVAVYCARKNGSDWEFLLLHRHPGNGNFWQGVTGGVEDDEEIGTTARRELCEETGFSPKVLKEIGYQYSFELRPEWQHLYDRSIREVTEHAFLAVITDLSDPVISAVEHDDWRWCSFEQAHELLYWDGNKESLSRCLAILRAIA